MSSFPDEILGQATPTTLSGDHVAQMSTLAVQTPSNWREQLKATAPASSDDASFLSTLANHKFDFTKPVPPPYPRFFINKSSVCTPRNLTTVIAQAKAGKSSFSAAAIAAVIVAEFGTQADTLGITATKPGNLPLIYFDTEQSSHDADRLIRSAIRRSGIKCSPPPWLWAYSLAGFSAADLLRALRLIAAKAWAEHGGVYAIIIDGVADLILDVNDAAESNQLVADLRALSVQYDCPVISVIHENPGADNGKGRGHLGSEFERKAESNLRLRKRNGVTVVFSEKMRGKPITLQDGPRFAWDDTAGMHMSLKGGAADAASLVDQQRVVTIFDSYRKHHANGVVRLGTVAGVMRVSEKTLRRIFTEAGGALQHEGEELVIHRGRIQSVFSRGEEAS